MRRSSGWWPWFGWMLLRTAYGVLAGYGLFSWVRDVYAALWAR